MSALTGLGLASRRARLPLSAVPGMALFNQFTAIGIEVARKLADARADDKELRSASPTPARP